MHQTKIAANRRRRLCVESLEQRQLLANAPFHNENFPVDVNGDGLLSPLDALVAINALNRQVDASSANSITSHFADVDANGSIAEDDIAVVTQAINEMLWDEEILPSESQDSLEIDDFEIEKMAESEAPGANPFDITTTEVTNLLKRASQATTSNDAIIAVVDRAGRILGVRTEQDVVNMYAGRPNDLVFAIDGAVAKARTAAFFSNNEAPITSRTVRFISQSTMTQREVESNPNILDLNSPYRGPGFVAPIGLGGHFPPQVANTPLVDLFAIEHQSRDSKVHPGTDGIKTAADAVLNARFNVNLAYVPTSAQDYMKLFPESYGTQSGILPFAQSRGIATMPGGIPLYKFNGNKPVLVGGIGVFFPGQFGYATYEQGFQHAAFRNGNIPQTEESRLNAPKALEAEFIAYFAAGGTVAGPAGMVMPVTEFEGKAYPRGAFGGIAGRIDLVGITLEIYGPTPTRANPASGQQQLFQVGRRNGGGMGLESGVNQKVTPGAGGLFALPGMTVPVGWLVNPHASAVDPLTAADVTRIVQQGINEANLTRAAIRLDLNTFRAGAKTKMVFAVTDSTGEVLGLYRMPDATVFSIDVAVAKARNTAYYASNRLVVADQVDVNNDLIPDVPKLTAFTNRTVRFLSGPRYPTGSVAGPGDFSMLTMPGINRNTAENILANIPWPASTYASPTANVVSFDSFNASRNFRDPANLTNQNGVVFFPGSTPLYKAIGTGRLVGGFGVSGDGVDQDDVVTVAGQYGFEAPARLRADQYMAAGVRLPYQKFNRNPQG